MTRGRGAYYALIAVSVKTPAVWRTGPVYRDDGLLCPCGILTEDEAMPGACQSTLRHGGQWTKDIIELSPGTFIIITPGELYSILCKGIPQKRESAKAGLYLVNLAPRCRIMGDNWFIEGLTQMNSSINMNFRAIPVLPLNLPNRVKDKRVWMPMVDPKWGHFHEIKGINLKKLDEVNLSDQSMIDLGSISHHVSGAALSLSIIVLVAVVVILIIFARRNFACILPCKGNTTGNMVEISNPQPSTVPLNDTTADESSHPNEHIGLTRGQVDKLYPQLRDAMKDSIVGLNPMASLP